MAKAGETQRLRLTDRKRRAIIDAAAAEFQRDGFDGASMNRIAATAKVSKRTVYNHFPSKEELFHAIVADLFNRTRSLQSVDYDSSASLEQQLTEIGRQFADLTMSDEFIRLARVVVSRFMHSPQLAAATLGSHEHRKAALIRWIKAAKNDGRLTVGNPTQAARQFTGLIQEFAFWPQLVGTENKLTKRELRQVVKAATNMFLAHYATNTGDQ